MSKENNLLNIRLDYQKNLINNFEMPLEDILDKINSDNEFYNDVYDYTSNYFKKITEEKSNSFNLPDELYKSRYNFLNSPFPLDENTPSYVIKFLLEDYIWNDLIKEHNILLTEEESVR